MNYEDALKEWGFIKLTEYHGPTVEIDKDLVSVQFEFSEGYACCGGANPDCYCSYAESPSSNVVIQAGQFRYEMYADDFDFSRVLKEIVEASGGNITA